MAETPAGLVLHNASSKPERRSFVQAAAIRDERFLATVSDQEVIPYHGQHTAVVDLNKSQRLTHPELVTESTRKCGDPATSGDLFQNVRSQLVAVFEARGCALPLAEELAQKLTREAKARVREVLWRLGLGATWISGLIEIGDLTLDLERHMLWRGDKEVHLTPKEFDLLALMMKNTNVLLSHVKLLRSVWGLEYGGELEYLRTAICSLRKKIENPEYIVSVPGIGYRFRNPADVARRSGQTEPCLESLRGEKRSKLQGAGSPRPQYLFPAPAVSIDELGGAQ